MGSISRRLQVASWFGIGAVAEDSRYFVVFSKLNWHIFILLRGYLGCAWEHGHPVRFQAGVSLETVFEVSSSKGSDLRN